MNQFSVTVTAKHVEMAIEAYKKRDKVFTNALAQAVQELFPDKVIVTGVHSIGIVEKGKNEMTVYSSENAQEQDVTLLSCHYELVIGCKNILPLLPITLKFTLV